MIQLHLIVWRGEIDFMDVFSKDIIKQVSYGRCHFSLSMRCGWDAPLCVAIEWLKEMGGKNTF